MIFLGVDTGLSGGLAALDCRASDVVPASVPMIVAGGDIDAAGIADWVRGYTSMSKQVLAAVESVHAMPHQGVSSCFTFGLGYGKVLGVLGALGVRLELVTPQAWKKVVLPGLIPSKPKLDAAATPAQKKAAAAAHKKAGKDAAIGWCRRAYPSLDLVLEGCRTPHDGMADSVCLAEFARLKYACS